MRSYSCPKCQGSMAQGFMLDNVHGSNAVGSWVEGAPEKSFWTGVKTSRKAKYEIETWRCGRCGFLENYARG